MSVMQKGSEQGHLSTPLDYAHLPRSELVARIRHRKDALNAVILGHNYQRVEIQEVSDFIGDSLALSQKAAATEADVIVFCGVRFMAETAKVLSPQKRVLMPDPRAGCPMADYATVTAVRRLIGEHPDAAIVVYVNSSAAVKALADVCCTSSNALRVVESFPADRPVLFVPDKNLADYVARATGRDNIIAWEGYCYVHDDLVLQELDAALEQHPGAKIVVHPEARRELLDRADYVTSTAGMVELAEKWDTLVIGTERGLVDALQRRYPDKTLIPLSRAAICGNMKVNTLAKLAWCLDHGRHEVEVPEAVRARAEDALRRMLELSGGWTGPTKEERRLEEAGLRAAGCGCA